MLDLADLKNDNYQFLRPLVAGWLSKIECALTCKARKQWHDVASECQMFYNRSAAAMWDSAYTKKFWRGVKPPRHRVSINKAFEYVAVFMPNLLWDVPHRQCAPKKPLQITPELFPDEQVFQAIQQQVAQESAKDVIVSHLMGSWLNYTPREQPQGLGWHNEMATLDAMLKGNGVLFAAPYSMPSSDKTLTGCFHQDPYDLIIDPDVKSLQKATWIALRHTEPHWKVEAKFKLPNGSLKSKSKLESSWHYAEMASRENEGQMTGERSSGKTNDLVVWYEVWSKLGTGARMTGMPDVLKNHLEDTVGDYAYLAICPDCPYPLNCPTDEIRNGATSDQIRKHFEWPVPTWTDDRWPCERLVFYEDPESPYGVPPLAPALGELKAINAIVSWLVNRTWQSSRQMWAVVQQYHDELKKVLEEGDDLSVVGLPVGADADLTKIISLIECNEINRDAWDILELLSNTFDKRMGMTPFVYGQNEDGTQDRTASTTEARKAAVGARPEYMQKKVVEWQGRLGGLEAIVAWLFVKGQDVLPSMGQVGAMLWQQHIENGDFEKVIRQTSFEVSASSVRRPNRDRNIANLNEFGQRFLPMIQTYGELTGNYEPANGYMEKFGELHDMDLEGLMFPAKDPNDPNAQLDQQLKQAEVQKTQAEAMKAQSEAQQNPAAIKAQELQLKAGIDQQKMQMDMEKSQAELAIEIKKMEMELAMKKAELAMKAQEHQMEMQFKREEGQMDLQLKQVEGAQKVQMGQQQLAIQREQGAAQVAATKAQASTKIATDRETAKTKIEATKQTTSAKVDATKKMAAAKPSSAK